MNRIVAILMHVLAVVSATAGICHYCDNAGVTRQYGYAYDNLNRLTAASYIESGRDYLGDVMMDNQPDYSTSYRYDLNGNPTKVSRYGMSELYTLNDGTPMMLWGPIDDITFTYDGNRVTRADDDIEPLLNLEATGFNEQATQNNEYTWDANGNMTRDLNKGITSISYNWLNLPNTIVYADGHKEIRYYSTAGEKLRTVYQSVITTSSSSATTYARYRTTDTRDYSGDFIYLNDSIETQLTANGYITPDGEYRFYLRDYQGNNRLTYTAAGVVLERNDYYPYGGLFGEEQSLQPYKYSGKEFETTNGLNLYDFHARYHDYTLPIFTTQDPLQEKYYDLSPYIYCAGNPIIHIDPTGMTFTEAAQKYADRLKEASFNLIKSGSISAESLEQAVATINEIIELDKSDQLYDVVEDKTLTKADAETRTNSANETVEIALKDMDSPLHLIAHEFKHLSQFERGEISLTDKGKTQKGYFVFDWTDEEVAYERGQIFGGPSMKSVDNSEYLKLPPQKIDVLTFLKSHFSHSLEKDYDTILRQRCKLVQQSFRFKSKTYMYHPK